MEQFFRRSASTSIFQAFRRRVSVVVMLFLLILPTAIIIHYSTDYQQQNLSQKQLFLQFAVYNITIAMINQETGLRGYIATRDENFLDPFHQGHASYLATMLQLSVALKDEQFRNTQTPLKQVSVRANAWYTIYALPQIHAIMLGATSIPQSLATARIGKAFFDRLRLAIAQLQRAIDYDISRAESILFYFRIASYIGSVLLFLPLMILVILSHTPVQIVENMGMQIQSILTTTRAFARGDYTTRINRLSYEELEEVGHALNDMADAIEHKQRELVESESNFRLMADAMPQIIWTARPDGWLDYYNQKWIDYTGMSIEQTAGWGWGPVLHPDDRQKCVDIWQHAVETGKTYEIEYRFKRASDGMYRWHLGRALPVKDVHGTILKWFGTSTDIHEWKMAEEKLALLLTREQQARKDAENARIALMQTNQAQRNFIAIVSHEFRTTLTSIQGFSALMRDEQYSLSEISEFASDINTDALRLLRMINELLDLEKMQSGKMNLLCESLNLNTLLYEVAERFRANIARGTIVLQPESKQLFIHGDQDKIIQVITNLLSNAIKYSPNGGEIRITSTTEGSFAHIRIRDHGMGIPEEMLHKIFTPYSRVLSTTTQYIQGTGLGLPIVKQIIEMHGGHIWVESTPGQGSCFHFTLPLEASRLVPAMSARQQGNITL